MYLITNWKANKNLNEAYFWIDSFLKDYSPDEKIKVIIAPPFPLIFPLKEKIKNTPQIFLAAQDVSFFEEGSFTGEVTAKTLQGLVDYVIIGHSERRKYFYENDEKIEKKVILAKKYNIEPILCIRHQNDKIFNLVKIIAYEPPDAIGTGKNEDPQNVVKIKQLLNLNSEISFLYGGSVNEKNVEEYLKTKIIDGFLIGSSSLVPQNFLSIFNKLKRKE
jgi:triosephosphate isomerase